MAHSATRRPNILFILTDDQRFDTIAALGNTEIDTPNLDRLVARGTTFTHAHIMGGTHQAVCMPSRAMLLTGRRLFSIERQGQRIPPAHICLPEHLRAHGYTTAHVGKWHQDRRSHARCFSTGAKVFGFKAHQGWYEAHNGHWHTPVHDFDASGEYDGERGYFDPPLEQFEAPFETVKQGGRHSVDVFTDAAADFLRTYPDSPEARDGHPFFMYLAHTAPHDPRQYPPELRERYRPDTVSLPESFAIRHPFDNGELLVRDELLEAHPRRPDAVRQHIADYYALITYVDQRLGQLMEVLEESGQADNTIVVFAGDNGLAVGRHGLMGKQNLYDHSLRVPLIFAGPGIPHGRRVDAGCYLFDIFPTLCDLSATPIPQTVEGRSLLPAIGDPSTVVYDTMYFAYRGFQRAVRHDGYKLIEYMVHGAREAQLFNVETDPGEMHNLIDSPSHQHRLRHMRELLLRLRTELGDTTDMGTEFYDGYAQSANQGDMT